ncbi:vancomycin high temperature exclusion protein [Rodentibacter caecimuris]|uniref:DUF218 domain-containing protein n=1 Tax=Rodentibacter caecimuris TaxID=1796644 RepID=A0ABX3KXL3_9PAST|nr:hypothetical protein BKG89_08235 [Rodentibacter heylii]
MTALLPRLKEILVKKYLKYLTGLIAIAIVSCVFIDQLISYSVQEKVYRYINDIPHRPYSMVLGTSKYFINGRPNQYYRYRLEAAKALIDEQKTDYLLLSGDNRTLQYNEPRMMFRDLRKMGVPENKMFYDFAGFRTLDSVIRADKIFQIQPMIIVSQQFHCERALFIAKWNNIDAICFAAQQPDTYLSTRIREIFARVKALIDVIFGVKPHFLGMPEPLPM